jgi:hypothetical protein
LQYGVNVTNCSYGHNTLPIPSYSHLCVKLPLGFEIGHNWIVPSPFLSNMLEIRLPPSDQQYVGFVAVTQAIPEGYFLSPGGVSMIRNTQGFW